MKKQFKVAVTWESYGTLNIEAETVEEALKIAEKTQDELPLPDDWDYVDGSFVIDRESTLAIDEGLGIDDPNNHD